MTENPLHKKLDSPRSSRRVIAPPDDDANPLLPLPEGCSALADADELAPRPVLASYSFSPAIGPSWRECSPLRDKFAPSGSLWISWIKQSSGARGRGLQATSTRT